MQSTACAIYIEYFRCDLAAGLNKYLQDILHVKIVFLNFPEILIHIIHDFV